MAMIFTFIVGIGGLGIIVRVIEAIELVKTYDDYIILVDIYSSPPKFWKSEPEPSCSAIKILSKTFSSEWDDKLSLHCPNWQYISGQSIEDLKIWYYHVHYSDFFWNSEILASEDYSLLGETPTIKIYVPSAIAAYSFLKFYKMKLMQKTSGESFSRTKLSKD
ncbi:uncharacterized protein LOC112501790 isoform X2 [Cynara cardunculus var. scolymus]|uniref:uncharacterized protein LOC112501790 isoform X2 n=1 Tax=Cynara cardunculus var. scolymus TaxID=59895 RepID=UPI000D625C6F|nr:uncharacterized protein LOC112501790 isoform X2 [Cynara cardunculus var. scolymus]